MQRRKVLSALLALGVTGGMLAACSSTNTPEAVDTTTPITLTVQQQTSQESLFKDIADAFHKQYPNVTVKLQTVSQEQKGGSNLAVLGSNNPPDVGMIPLGSTVYSQLIAAKGLAPLTDVYQSADLEKRLGSSVVDSVKVNGVPYVAPYSSVIYNVVWLNPDLLKKAGLGAPKDHKFESVDQFLDYAKKLEAAGSEGGFLLGGNSGFQASWMIDALLPSSSTKDQLANYLSNYDSTVKITAKYTDPAFLNVLKTLDKFNKAGIYQKGFLGQDAPTAMAPFLQGKAGMLLGGNFTTSDFDKAKIAFTPDFASLPPVDNAVGPQGFNPYFGDSIGVPAKSKHVAWAKKFVEFVMSDAVQKGIIIDKQGLLPAISGLSASDLKALPELTQQLLAEGGTPNAGWTSTVPGAASQQFIDPLIQQMYAGQLTPEQVAEKQQANIIDYRQKNPSTK